jgi:hypothetical protein
MSACRRQGTISNPGFPYHMSAASLLNGDVAPRLLPKPPIAEALASLSIPPIAVTEPAPMSAVKAKDAVRKPPKKEAKLPSVAPKIPSPTPKVASSALEATPKVATPTAEAPVEEVKRPSIAAKQAAKPAPKKMAEAQRAPAQPNKQKTAAVNGKLVVRKSKREVR